MNKISSHFARGLRRQSYCRLHATFESQVWLEQTLNITIKQFVSRRSCAATKPLYACRGSIRTPVLQERAVVEAFTGDPMPASGPQRRMVRELSITAEQANDEWSVMVTTYSLLRLFRPWLTMARWSGTLRPVPCKHGGCARRHQMRYD